jgi:hypothetical protein
VSETAQKVKLDRLMNELSVVVNELGALAKVRIDE